MFALPAKALATGAFALKSGTLALVAGTFSLVDCIAIFALPLLYTDLQLVPGGARVGPLLFSYDLNLQKSTDDENAEWNELVKRLPMIHESGIANPFGHHSYIRT